jgi:hypothetical protein
MSKAYDQVKWLFLGAMMLRLRFQEVWIDLIMKCMSSVSCRVKVNDNLSASFQHHFCSCYALKGLVLY